MVAVHLARLSFNGRSSILFAVLAGVSLALLSGRTDPVRGDDLVRARTRILVRAAWVFAIGGALEALGTDVDIILGVYAVSSSSLCRSCGGRLGSCSSQQVCSPC